MTPLPPVAITATTVSMDGQPRIRANVAYTAAARAAGLRPYVLPVLAPQDAETMLDGMGGLVLTGGEDVTPSLYGARPHPALGDVNGARDAFEIALVHAARERGLPTLAICRGIQIANVALGGTLVQDLPSEWPQSLQHDGDWERNRRVHAVSITPGSRLAKALGVEQLVANSLHHQAVKTLAPGLTTVAVAPDGVVEGVEWTASDWWLACVQWHPEELTGTKDGWDRALFAAFATVAREYVLSAAGASALRS